VVEQKDVSLVPDVVGFRTDENFERTVPVDVADDGIDLNGFLKALAPEDPTARLLDGQDRPLLVEAVDGLLGSAGAETDR